ncbi:hypothetical protein [Tuwongella immobilis]|uniref:Uncharacterized protein n=1 Tax=Tuwongella immobilis TaxID=692036 RepID=A0A6C2YN67_9BACT|nr:hypothetical protein [Tuwongella immobilis]VIP02342.1 unnamed protein product [Tuwongella immobilis]VTS01112.1 unnamed protein product [Tuwongella immobilis]
MSRLRRWLVGLSLGFAVTGTALLGPLPARSESKTAPAKLPRDLAILPGDTAAVLSFQPGTLLRDKDIARLRQAIEAADYDLLLQFERAFGVAVDRMDRFSITWLDVTSPAATYFITADQPLVRREWVAKLAPLLIQSPFLGKEGEPLNINIGKYSRIKGADRTIFAVNTQTMLVAPNEHRANCIDLIKAESTPALTGPMRWAIEKAPTRPVMLAANGRVLRPVIIEQIGERPRLPIRVLLDTQLLAVLVDRVDNRFEFDATFHYSTVELAERARQLLSAIQFFMGLETAYIKSRLSPEKCTQEQRTLVDALIRSLNEAQVTREDRVVHVKTSGLIRELLSPGWADLRPALYAFFNGDDAPPKLPPNPPANQTGPTESKLMPKPAAKPSESPALTPNR